MEDLKRQIMVRGADKVGFADVTPALEERLKDTPKAVSFAVRLSDKIIGDMENEPTFTYFHHYRSVNFLIDQISLWISIELQRAGYLAMAVPASQTVHNGQKAHTGIFQHKTGAVLSGLGWIGKNGLLITPEFGPRVRLGTVLTNAPLPTAGTALSEGCGTCRRCVEACPANALKGTHWVMGMEREELLDAEACNQHMRKHYMHIGRGSVCGLCIKACPKGQEVLKR